MGISLVLCVAAASSAWIPSEPVGVFGAPGNGAAPATGWNCAAELTEQNLVISPEFYPAHFGKYDFSTTATFSMKAVIRPLMAAPGTTYSMISKSERCNTNFSGGDLAGEDWALELRSVQVATDVFFCPVLRVTGTSGSIEFFSSTLIPSDQWSTIQFSFDNRTDPPIVLLGANGQVSNVAAGLPPGSMPVRTAPISSRRRIWIGSNPAHPTSVSTAFQGEIYEIPIWNRARTMQEMSPCDGRTNPPTQDAALIGYYRFGSPFELGGRVVSVDAFLPTAAHAVLGTHGIDNRTFPGRTLVQNLPILRTAALESPIRPGLNEFVFSVDAGTAFTGQYQWYRFIVPTQTWVPLTDGLLEFGSSVEGANQRQLRVTMRHMQDAIRVRARAYYEGCNDSRAKTTSSVEAACEGDFNRDGVLNILDVLDLVAALGHEEPQADINHDSAFDLFDYLDLLEAIIRGC